MWGEGLVENVGGMRRLAENIGIPSYGGVGLKLLKKNVILYLNVT